MSSVDILAEGKRKFQGQVRSEARACILCLRTARRTAGLERGEWVGVGGGDEIREE